MPLNPFYYKTQEVKHMYAIQESAKKINGVELQTFCREVQTLRRHGYGYPDDEYFFLKLFDMSRQGYVRNMPSHRFND